MGIKVCKFGGTSLADAQAFRRCVSLVEADQERRYIVVSAPGKRAPDDHKITDLLLTCHGLARHSLDFSQPWGIIEARFCAMAEELALDVDIHGLLATLLEQLKAGGSRDLIASRGEYICGKMMAGILAAEFVDPREALTIRRSTGHVSEESYQALRERLDGPGRFVIPGFYASDRHGDVVTFPRGGSDITGAIVARAVGADVYENWTDVSGLLLTDPKVVPDAEPIHEVTHRELRELSYMGAKVLHEASIFPVRDAGIPIHIRNTLDPDAPGTRVVVDRDLAKRPVVGIAGRTGCSTIYIEKPMMNEDRGFGRRVLEVLEVHDINWLHAPSGIDSMSIVVWDEELEGKGESYLEEIQRVLEPERIELITGLSLIATVGLGMANTAGISGRLFGALGEARVNVRMIDQGSSEINIVVAVATEDYAKAVRAIYDAFVVQEFLRR